MPEHWNRSFPYDDLLLNRVFDWPTSEVWKLKTTANALVLQAIRISDIDRKIKNHDKEAHVHDLWAKGENQNDHFEDRRSWPVVDCFPEILVGIELG
jgi:hypothetical protein